MASKNGQVM